MYIHNQRLGDQEARLCHQYGVNNVPPGPASIPPDPSNWVENYVGGARVWLESVAKDIAWLTGEIAQQAALLTVGVPVSVLEGIKNAWKGSKTEFMSQLQRANLFFRDLPLIRNFFEHLSLIEDGQTLLNLLDHAKWITAFRDNPDILNNPPATATLPNGVFGPKELLLSLSPEDRQTIYLEYLDAFIPPQIQNEMGISYPENATLQERMSVVAYHKNTLNGALGGIFGMKNWDKNLPDQNAKDYSELIAQKSLRSYYNMDNPAMPDFVSKGARDDYAKALEYQRLKGVDIVATDPNRLMERIGSCRFKGALMMGVMERDELEYIAGGLKELDHEKRLSRANVHRHMEGLMQGNANEYKKEAEGLLNTWNNMGGIEKLLLVGALTYGLMKWRFVRGSAMVLTGAYFFQKFVLKQNDPLQSWSNLVGGTGNLMKGTNKKLFGEDMPTPGYVDDVANRTGVIMNFLDDYSIYQLERQSIGFGVLYDMPMNVLARNFQMAGKDGEDMRLNVGDTLFDNQISASLKARGLNGLRFREFLSDQHNREQTTEATSYVFFLQAARDPRNKPNVEYVMEVLRMLPPGTSFSVFGYVAKDFENTIPDPETRLAFQRAHEMYIRLVGEGCDRSMGDSQTLGDFMKKNAGVELSEVEVGPADVTAAPPGPAESSVPPGPAIHNTAPGATSSAPPGSVNSIPPGSHTSVAPGSGVSIAPGAVSSTPPRSVNSIPPNSSNVTPPGFTNATPPANKERPTVGSTSVEAPGSGENSAPGSSLNNPSVAAESVPPSAQPEKPPHSLKRRPHGAKE